MNITLSQPPAIVYAGLDESGSLTAESPFFVMAAVITAEPRVLHHLTPRAVTRSGKRLGRSAKDAGEIKWRNASQRIRALVLAIDRHFTSPVQVATVNTWIYRRWPPPGVLSIVHVESQRNTLVQLGDMVAGSLYAWHKSGDRTMELIAKKFRATEVKDWRYIKGHWLDVG